MFKSDISEESDNCEILANRIIAQIIQDDEDMLQNIVNLEKIPYAVLPNGLKWEWLYILENMIQFHWLAMILSWVKF